MATLYVIPNWEIDFENPRSRDIVSATYFCVSNSFDGRRMRRLQKLDAPLELYGAFHVICALSSKCLYRGVLMDSHGPLTAVDIAEKSGFDDEGAIEIFARSLEQLSQPMIALLEKHEIEQADDGGWTLPQAVARWALSAEDRRGLRAGTRGHKQPREAERGQRRTTSNGATPPKERTHADSGGHKQPHASGTEQNRTEQQPSAVSLEGRQLTAFICNGRITLPTDQHGKQQAIAFAKAAICQKILGGKDPGRPWSRDAMDRLTELLQSGLPITEIDRIAWWRSLPESQDVPELRDRKFITETGLMNFWGDEFSRATAYWKKTHPRDAQKKEEPVRWKEFFRWKYPDKCRLPDSFWDLEKDQRDEYERDFQTFERGQKQEAFA